MSGPTDPAGAGSRRLGDLGLTALWVAGPAPDAATPVEAVAIDSRAVRPGTVFVALPGSRVDGAAYIPAAIAAGAVAVVARPGAAPPAPSVPVFAVENPLLWAARLAAQVAGAQPATLVAVTGTNGKTSTTEFLRQIWTRAGLAAAALGTTGVTAPGVSEPLGMTTPDPVTLHRLLARLARAGVTHAAMEASSHGLAQYRLDGAVLTAAGLSNITRDHLDYHADPAAYAAAKLRLFGEVLPPGGTAVLNADDPSFAAAAAAARARGARVIAVGRGAGADLAVRPGRREAGGQEVVYGWGGVAHPVTLALVGGFQADNVGLAVGLALACGLAPEQVFAALPHLTGVRGRMERVARLENGAAVYVDYAHTPDALAVALDALRAHCPGRLVCVFGAGGDRDPGKRPLMGAAVAARADLALITDDNPRGEDPAAIRAAVALGAPEATQIGDRAQAIAAGVAALTGPDDALLIAGKGHEQGQEVAGRTHPFDDAAVARAAVRDAGGAA